MSVHEMLIAVMAVFAAAGALDRIFGSRLGLGQPFEEGILAMGTLALAMLGWLYYREFCSWAFYSYDSMLRPGILFLMLTMLIGVVRIFQRRVSKEEKLLSGMVVLVVFLTSIGSNNEVLPSMNNLFVAAPYTFWQCAGFVARRRPGEKKGMILHPFPAKQKTLHYMQSGK